MNNEYVIINKTELLKEIEELEKWNYMQEGATTYRSPMHLESSRRLIIQNKEVILKLKKTLSQSTPLIPEIEKAFDAGGVFCFNVNIDKKYDGDKQDYIANLKLDI